MGEIGMEPHPSRICGRFSLRDIPIDFSLRFVYCVEVDLIFAIVEREARAQ
jgi:hypothetical protein